MSIKAYSKSVVFLLPFVLIAHVAYNYYIKKKKKEPRNEIYDVIMFSRETGEMKKSKYSRCMITQSMNRMLHYLNLPRHSLDICMYVLTNMDVTNAVLKLHCRGVRIRLIIDADMAFCSGSNVRRFEKQGIPVRWMKSTNIMHHKFCLIDSPGEDGAISFVMAGSLNWTNQALYGNWENVLITSHESIVEQYKAEFEKLWVQFKPIVS